MSSRVRWPAIAGCAFGAALGGRFVCPQCLTDQQTQELEELRTIGARFASIEAEQHVLLGEKVELEHRRAGLEASLRLAPHSRGGCDDNARRPHPGYDDNARRPHPG